MNQVQKQQEAFAPIDRAFAKALSKSYLGLEDEEIFSALCYLSASARQGHLCVEIEEDRLLPGPSFLSLEAFIEKSLERQVIKGLQKLSDPLCRPVVPDVLPSSPLCQDQNVFYLQRSWLLETKVLSQFKRIVSGDFRLKPTQEIPLNPQLNQQQKNAVGLALSSPLSLISGGPGTGKTFTAVEIVKTFLASLSERDRKTALIKISAPTGKAAVHLETKIKQSLGSLCLLECGTLHSLLGVGKRHPSTSKVPSVFADLFLVDETSMVDAALFARLFASFEQGGRLVLMGDRHQLPPVEAGAFFGDLLSCRKIPSIFLDECLRAEKKELIDFAGALLQGDVSQVLSSPFVHLFSSVRKVRESVWQKCFEFFSKDLEQMQRFRVLSCLRQGPLGVESLNEMVLGRFLEGKDDEAFLEVPLLITENCEPLRLMNGDTGYIKARVSSYRRKQFSREDTAYFQNRSLSALLLPSFEWGYCLSVHKSQGSEYDSVMALAPSGSERFGREVLYTAITRAKKEIHLWAEESSLKVLLSRKVEKKSGIGRRIQLL